MRALFVPIVLLVTCSTPAVLAATPLCHLRGDDAWVLAVDCMHAPAGLAVWAERYDDVFWTVHASGCFEAPTDVVLSWGMLFADAPAGSTTVATHPQQEADCPHVLQITLRVDEGTFDPPYTCASVTGVTRDGASAFWASCADV